MLLLPRAKIVVFRSTASLMFKQRFNAFFINYIQHMCLSFILWLQEEKRRIRQEIRLAAASFDG